MPGCRAGIHPANRRVETRPTFEGRNKPALAGVSGIVGATVRSPLRGIAVCLAKRDGVTNPVRLRNSHFDMGIGRVRRT